MLSSALDNLQGAEQIKALVQDFASTYSSDRGRARVPQELVSFLLADWPTFSKSDQWEVDCLIKAVEPDVLRQLGLAWQVIVDRRTTERRIGVSLLGMADLALRSAWASKWNPALCMWNAFAQRANCRSGYRC